MEVTYLDHMSSDLGVVNAARVSFSKQSDWEYTRELETEKGGGLKLGDYTAVGLKEKDTKLIHYLAREGHWLPFRHPHVSFHCKAPLFVARQAGKHQVGMSWSEVSRRYVDTEPEFYTPEAWRKRADDKKQGSSAETIVIKGSVDSVGQFYSEMQTLYRNLINQGVCPEQARILMPQAQMTEWVWTGSLLSWVHFIKLRTAPDAQKEIQDFAKLFMPTLEELYPVSYKALTEKWL